MRLTVDDFDYAPWIECWQCGGEGEVASCFEEFACLDPEEGCDDCRRPCDICNGKGGWPEDYSAEAGRQALAQRDGGERC